MIKVIYILILVDIFYLQANDTLKIDSILVTKPNNLFSMTLFRNNTIGLDYQTKIKQFGQYNAIYFTSGFAAVLTNTAYPENNFPPRNIAIPLEINYNFGGNNCFGVDVGNLIYFNTIDDNYPINSMNRFYISPNYTYKKVKKEFIRGEIVNVDGSFFTIGIVLAMTVKNNLSNFDIVEGSLKISFNLWTID